MSFLKLSPPRRLLCTAPLLLVLSGPVSFSQVGVTSAPQQSQPAPSTPKPSDILHSALSQVSQAIASLNIPRWKAPSEVRAATQQNVDSIQRDLNNTLPGLLSSADAAPTSVYAVFPVYRNIDALYDVLLRVSQTTMLVASQNEATSITDALSKLESARSDLGNSILDTSKRNEADTVQLRTALQRATAAAQAVPAAPKTTIVNDGPATSSTTKRKKKPATPPANSQPSPQQ